jgi:hypothetical protein
MTKRNHRGKILRSKNGARIFFNKTSKPQETKAEIFKGNYIESQNFCIADNQ